MEQRMEGKETAARSMQSTRSRLLGIARTKPLQTRTEAGNKQD